MHAVHFTSCRRSRVDGVSVAMDHAGMLYMVSERFRDNDMANVEGSASNKPPPSGGKRGRLARQGGRVFPAGRL